jgi:hypothetical protein
MARFVILVQFNVDPSHVAAFRQEMLDTTAATRNTPGNRGFDVSQDPLEPSRFMLYEVFEVNPPGRRITPGANCRTTAIVSSRCWRPSRSAA